MNKQKANLLIIIASVLFSLGGLFIKMVPWNAIAINGGRCFFSSMIVLGYMKLNHHRLIINKTTIFGGLACFMTSMCFAIATKWTTAANAIVLQYTSLFFIVLFNYLIFKIRAEKVDIIACISIILGVMMVCNNGLGGGTVKGNILAIVAGCAYAFVCMSNTFKKGDSLSSVFIGHFSCFVVGAPFVLFERDFSSVVLLNVAILGIVQLGLGYVCFSVGLKYTDSLSANLLATIEAILNPILVAIFYKEMIGWISIMGCILIIVTIMLHNVVKSKKFA